MTDDSIHIGEERRDAGADETRTGDASTMSEPQSLVAAAPVLESRDFASESLAFLLRDLGRQGAEGESLARRLAELHPDSQRLGSIVPRNDSFKDLLFDELAALESDSMGVVVDARLLQREPLAYWLRRRELSRHADLARVCERLPPVFAVLTKSPDRLVLAGCVELSARMIAGVLLAKPDLDLREFLRPLARDTQRRVMELIDATRGSAPDAPRVQAIDTALAEIWQAGIERISSDPARGPRRVGELLGRMLLATLLERVDRELVKRAIDCAVTVIFHKLLESDVFAIDFDGPHGGLVDELAVGVFLSGGA